MLLEGRHFFHPPAVEFNLKIEIPPASQCTACQRAKRVFIHVANMFDFPAGVPAFVYRFDHVLSFSRIFPTYGLPSVMLDVVARVVLHSAPSNKCVAGVMP